MMAYRTLGGATIPPFYGEQVLPTHAAVVGIELIPNQPSNAPVISWNGWHQFLLQKILFEPEAHLLHFSRVLAALGIPITLTRADFPPAPDPSAQVKEAQFKTQIYALARAGLGVGAFGGRWGAAGGLGSGVGAPGKAPSTSSVAAQAMIKLATQGGMNLMNGGSGGSWFMPS